MIFLEVLIPVRQLYKKRTQFFFSFEPQKIYTCTPSSFLEVIIPVCQLYKKGTFTKTKISFEPQNIYTYTPIFFLEVLIPDCQLTHTCIHTDVHLHGNVAHAHEERCMEACNVVADRSRKLLLCEHQFTLGGRSPLDV